MSTPGPVTRFRFNTLLPGPQGDQGPPGGLSAVSGSGFWHSTAGALDSAASHGAAGQLPFGGASDVSWAAPTGDLSLAGTAFTVEGIQGHSVPAPTGTNTTLQWSGSAFSWASASGGITQLTGDVTAGPGTGSQAATVGGLKGVALPALAAGLLEYTGSAWAFVTTASVFTAGGDLSGSPTSQTVVGVRGISVPVPSGTNTVLQYNAGAYSWATVSSGVTWANDMAGSTNSAQYVAAISGNAGAGGTVTLGATVNLTATAGAGALTLGAWTGNTTLPTGTLGWAGASGKAASIVATAAAITVTAGAASTWSTSSGALTLTSAAAATWGCTVGALALNSGTGISLEVGGTAYAQVISTALNLGASSTFSISFQSTVTGGSIGFAGAASSAGAALTMIAQSAGGTAQPGGNIQLTSGSPTTTGTPGLIILKLAAVVSGTTHGQIQFEEPNGGSNVGFCNWTTDNSVSYGSAPPAANNPANTYAWCQIPNASAASAGPGTPGSFNVMLGTPIAGGTQAGLKVYQGTSFYASMGPLVQNNLYGALYLGPNLTPNASNWCIICDGSANTYFNGQSGGLVAMAINAVPVAAAVGVGGLCGNSGQSLALGMVATASSASVATSFSLSAAQYACPIIRLSGTVNGGTGTCSVTLPNQVGAFWIFDLGGVTFSSGTLLFTTGSGTTYSMTSSSLLGGCKGVVIYIPATNVVAAAM